MICLALDPGSRMTGFARVEITGGGCLPIVVRYLTAGNVLSQPTALAPLLKDVDVIGNEKLEGIAYPVKGVGIVGHLISSSYASGVITGIACARGIRVIEMPARTWRGSVLGKPNASDQLIAEMIPRLVKDCPARTNVHVRDALGVAMGVAWHLGGDVQLNRRRIA